MTNSERDLWWRIATEIAEEFCGGSEAVAQCIEAKLVAAASPEATPSTPPEGIVIPDLQKIAREQANIIAELQQKLAASAPALAKAIEQARDAAFEQAAAECKRHAEFCKYEADRGGDREHLMPRRDEATYLASRIAALRAASEVKGK